MRSENFIKKLEQYNFKRSNFFDEKTLEQLNGKNIDVWINDSRLIMLKEYKTQKAIIEWNETDQLFVSTILNKIPNKFLNNFYYFVLINFEYNNIKIKLEINKIEKNELIFKKYVIKNQSDVERVPFLNDFKAKNENFSFDEKFRREILKFQTFFPEIIENLIDNYFEKYSLSGESLSNNNLNEFNEDKIKNMLKIGE